MYFLEGRDRVCFANYCVSISLNKVWHIVKSNGNIKHNTIEYKSKQAFHNLAFADLFSYILCIDLSPISHMQLSSLNRSQTHTVFHVSKSLLMAFFCQDTPLCLSPCSSQALFFIQIIFSFALQALLDSAGPFLGAF